MEKTTRGSRFCRVVAGTAALVIAALCGGGGCATSDVHRRNRELLAEVEARPAGRPVLRGEATAGNAWDDYEQAFREVGRLEGEDKALIDDHDLEEADPATVRSVLRRYEAAIDHMRRGAARGESRYVYRWEQGVEMRQPGLLPCQRLMTLCSARARLLAEQGRVREAAELLLDECVLGRDAAHNGTILSEMLGYTIFGTALDNLRTLLAARRPGKRDLAALSRELETLDRMLPSHGQVVLNGRLLFALVLQKQGELAMQRGAHAMDAMDAWLREAAGCESKPWAEARETYRRIEREVQSSSDPLVREVGATGTAGLLTYELTVREFRAKLRLMRAAVGWLASGATPDLEDPFGGRLRSEADDEKLAVWSVGRDGQDDDGRGGWMATADGDIVLEMRIAP